MKLTFCPSCKGLVYGRVCKCGWQKQLTESTAISFNQQAAVNHTQKVEGIPIDKLCPGCGKPLLWMQRQTRAPDESPSEFLICSTCNTRTRIA